MSGHTVLRSTVFTLASICVFGCGERTGPLEPALTPLDAGSTREQLRVEAASKILQRSKSLKADIVATATIGPEGGSLVIEDAGLMVLFPHGAVSSQLTVFATAARGKNVLYTFEPHGVQFSRPIIIAQLLSATTYTKRNRELAPSLQGGYLPNGVQDVNALGMATFAETFATAYMVRGGSAYVAFATNHFSGYAMASGRSGLDFISLP
jgi:hypothetical protein